MLYGFVCYTPLIEICESNISAFVSVGKEMAKLLHGPFIGHEHGFALTLSLLLGVGQLALFNLDAIFAGQLAKSILIANALLLHDEVDRRATFVARKAVTEISGSVDRERGRAFVVKRTQPHIVGTTPCEMHIIADNFYNVGGILDSLGCCLVNHR